MGKTYNLGKKELNNFIQECAMKCLKNKDTVDSVIKNTLNEWGVIRVPDGKGGHKFILDNSDKDRNVYIDNNNNETNNLINIDTRTYIGKDKGTYDIENAPGYSKYILFSTLAELLKINSNIFTEGNFKQISVSLGNLLDKMVEIHSQQQTVNEKKINNQPLKKLPLNQKIVNKQPENQNIVNKQPVDNINIKNIILNIGQYCLEAINLIGQLKTNPRYQNVISNDFVKSSVNYINNSHFKIQHNKQIENAISSDLSQLATIFAGKIKDPKTVYYFIQQETKLMSTILNHRKLNQEYEQNKVDEKDRLSYYQAILPGTGVDVISLFSFSNFAGTEIIKANAISTAATPIEKLYGTPPEESDKKRVNITWEGGDNLNPEDYFNDGKSHGHKFVQLILSHAENVLTRINYIPNFIICVPSTAKFNENMIKALAQKFGNCRSYEAFMVKNWLEYQMSDEDKQKIENYLSYRKYQYGETEYQASVGGFEELVSRAVGITFCNMISSYIKENNVIMGIINEYPNKKTFMKNYILKLVLQQMCKVDENFLFFINNNNIVKKTYSPNYKNAKEYLKNKLNFNEVIKEIAEQALKGFQDYLPKDGQPPLKPLQININRIAWKDTGVQMTSLVASGYSITTNKDSKLTATDARPLMVSVYIVNQKKYELTKDGQRLIQDLQAVSDIPGQLNETEKVEINNKRILIFDDDIDTGASMKLCVESMEKILQRYDIKSTEMKGLTAFTNLESQKTEDTSN